jgi:exodeoxyribonuclease-1
LNNNETFYWHDYETFGLDSKKDRPSQFAGIRTDLDFNIIGDPLNIYCKPQLDMLPSPSACLVTGITPQQAEKEGVNENVFFDMIEKQLNTPNTCGIGYNSINFDDEFTRNGFYRNFINPYEREWSSGSSRWDMINIARVMVALDPNCIKVPLKEDGKPSFKLDELSVANGIDHHNAHDAMSDVYATIGLAKKLKESNPELFNSLYNQRLKRNVSSNIEMGKPLLMADSYFGADNSFTEILYPIKINNANKNEMYCIKLSKNLDNLLELTPEEINQKFFKKSVDLQEGEERLPIHIIKINKCPVLLPTSVINKEISQRLNIDGQLCRDNILKLKPLSDSLGSNIEIGLNMGIYPDENDVDLKIYDGFLSKEENNEAKKIKRTQISQLDNIEIHLGSESKLHEMFFRYKARNYFESLDEPEKNKWLAFSIKKLTNKDGHFLTFKKYKEELELLEETDLSPDQQNIVSELKKYGTILKNKLINNPSSPNKKSRNTNRI